MPVQLNRPGISLILGGLWFENLPAEEADFQRRLIYSKQLRRNRSRPPRNKAYRRSKHDETRIKGAENLTRAFENFIDKSKLVFGRHENRLAQKALKIALGYTPAPAQLHLGNLLLLSETTAMSSAIFRDFGAAFDRKDYNVYSITIKPEMGNTSCYADAPDMAKIWEQVSQHLMRRLRKLSERFELIVRVEIEVFKGEDGTFVFSYHFHGVLVSKDSISLKQLNEGDVERFKSRFDKGLPFYISEIVDESTYDGIVRASSYASKVPIKLNYASFGLKAKRRKPPNEVLLLALLQLRKISLNSAFRAIGSEARTYKQTLHYQLKKSSQANFLQRDRTNTTSRCCNCSFNSQVNQPEELCEGIYCLKQMDKSIRNYLETLINIDGLGSCRKLLNPES